MDRRVVALPYEVPQGNVDRTDAHSVVLSKRTLDLAPVSLSLERVLPDEVVGDDVVLSGGGRVSADVLAGNSFVRVGSDPKEFAFGRLSQVVDEVESVFVGSAIFELVGELDTFDASNLWTLTAYVRK